MSYENPIPVSVCVIPVKLSDGSFALFGIERGIQPGLGGLALPGGYVDKGETAEMAAARELLEEAGLLTDAEDWQLTHSGITAANRMLVFCALRRAISEQEAQQFVPSSEAPRYKLLTKEDQLVFPLHQEALDKFFKQ